MMTPLHGLSEIIHDYDRFLLDQFGVLHDGRVPYDGTVEALRLLRGSSKPVAIISNSGRRAEPNIARMDRMGIARDLYDEMITSGEVAWHILAAELPRDDPARKTRCFMITSGQGHSPIEGLNVEAVTSAGDADIVLLAGSEGDMYTEEHYRALLAPAAANGAACICTNPDKIALGPNGRFFGPGRIANIYQELGGAVRWIGKPFAEIYHQAAASLPGTASARTICVGDSIEHDIAGARAAGFDSVLVTGGILAGKTTAELTEIARSHDAMPNFLIPSFQP